MVMHRALFTWFILLTFLILLSLRLEHRMHWNWFLIFLPLWVFDTILIIDAFFSIFIWCKHESSRTLFKNKNIILVGVVLLKVAAQIILCLKLEYNLLSMYHLIVLLWILLPILILDISLTLFKSSNMSY